MENMHTDVRGYRVKDLSWHAVRMGEYGRYVLVKNLKQVSQTATIQWVLALYRLHVIIHHKPNPYFTSQ